MEKLKKKHNHSLTNILKVLTFAIVLLFPFLVFMPTAFYYGFNEHAQVEIPQKVAKYETNEINNDNDIKTGNIYKFKTNELYIDDIVASNEYIAFKLITPLTINEQGLEQQSYTTNFQKFEPNLYIKLRQTNIGDLTLTTYYTYDDYLNENYNNQYTYIETFLNDIYIIYIESNKTEDLAWLFEYSDYNIYEISETTSISENLSNSWENMWQTPLFKWTENTPFTATTNAFASVFNISQESGFYNLIAYFITITGIYLIIDIVLGVATWLTHMIGRQD